MNNFNKKIRCAVVGARRGKTFIESAQTIGDERFKLTAICDSNPSMLEEWTRHSDIHLYRDFDDVLNDPQIDAVCIATPVPLHARQSISALEAGKHVLSEVTAAYTIEECWDLVEAVEHTGLTYMMAENYCFMDQVLQVQNMVDLGVFGELTYASGSYIHDCRDLFFTNEGELTWRGKLRHNLLANSYPTHSLGPVARWLNVNRADFLKSTATWNSRCASVPAYVRRNYSDKEKYENPEFWAHSDTVTTSIKTENGALIDIRVDWASARPHHMNRYELQGTQAAFSWPDGQGSQEALIWIQDRSPTKKNGIADGWEPLSKYREEFQHPLWRAHREQAACTGHGGSDYFVLGEFAAAIREERPPLIDVYDAVTWSSITPLSMLSIENGNAPIEVPNFKNRR